MKNFTTYFTQAQFSLAAYADLSVGDVDELALIDSGFSKPSASRFADSYSVADRYSDSSGLSATVFVDKTTDQRYLAIRGTEPTDLGDLLNDLIIMIGYEMLLSSQYRA